MGWQKGWWRAEVKEVAHGRGVLVERADVECDAHKIAVTWGRGMECEFHTPYRFRRFMSFSHETYHFFFGHVLIMFATSGACTNRYSASAGELLRLWPQARDPESLSLKHANRLSMQR